MRFGKSAIYLEHLQTWYLFVQYPHFTASRRNVCKPTQHAFMHYIFVDIWSLAWHNFVLYLNWMSPTRVGEGLQNYLIRHYYLSNDIHIASAREEYLQRASHTFILTNTILTNQKNPVRYLRFISRVFQLSWQTKISHLTYHGFWNQNIPSSKILE